MTFSTRPATGTAAARAATGASSNARRTRVTWYGSSNCSTVTSLYGTLSVRAASRTVVPRGDPATPGDRPDYLTSAVETLDEAVEGAAAELAKCDERCKDGGC